MRDFLQDVGIMEHFHLSERQVKEEISEETRIKIIAYLNGKAEALQQQTKRK